jgi:hypothetical protein
MATLCGHFIGCLRILCLEFHALRTVEMSPVSAPDGIDVEAFFSRSRAPASTDPPDHGDIDYRPPVNARR